MRACGSPVVCCSETKRSEPRESDFEERTERAGLTRQLAWLCAGLAGVKASVTFVCVQL